ncbi:hypothetical protein Salmuc_01719 [Salipiger mucosus DSM 16094]|uniref:Uncharacterized protein n=2 Tax=Salipiger mucosus TaxID=263378 RepID=S9SCH2_9RHOB|nr:hypothetical protein Salmuc_01719 [Salipiger mucosus DSM 16094]
MQMQGRDPEVTWSPMYDNRLLNGPTYILKTETGGVYDPSTGWTPKEIANECILFGWEVDDLKAKLGDDLEGLTVCTYSKLEAVAPLYAAVPGEEDNFEPADCIEEAATFSVGILLRFPTTDEDDVLVTGYEERDVGLDEIEDVVNSVARNFPAAEIDADLFGALETLGTPGPRF